MELGEFLAGADIFYSAVLGVSLLVMLYAMSLMNRAIRMLQYQVSVIENDLKLISEEIKMIGGGPRQDLSKIKPVGTDGL